MSVRQRTVVLWVVLAALSRGTVQQAAGAWVWTPLDYAGARFTQANDVSGNSVVGAYGDASGRDHGFLYSGGSWTRLDFNNDAPIDFAASGISGSKIIGCYDDEVSRGALYDGGKWTTISFPGATFGTQALGIDGNTIVGVYYETGGPFHGFRYDGATWAALDYPGVAHTLVNGISGNKVVGRYYDAYVAHGFVYDGTVWTTLDYPGAAYTDAIGICGNNIVGEYQDGSGRWYGFLYDGTAWTRLDYPGATVTCANGIDGNLIVGTYLDAQGGNHGFLVQVPEPASLALLALAALAAMTPRSTGRHGRCHGRCQAIDRFSLCVRSHSEALLKPVKSTASAGDTRLIDGSSPWQQAYARITSR